jgi:hypothetical protein
MDLQDDPQRRLLRLELEIDGKVVDSKLVYKSNYDYEFKKMRLRAITQRLPWAIFKTISRTANTVPKTNTI